MKRVLFLLMFLFIAVISFGEDGIYILKGTIGNKKIKMDLVECRNKIYANYYDETTGENFSISGDIKDENFITLKNDKIKMKGKRAEGIFSGEFIGEEQKREKFKFVINRDKSIKIINLMQETKNSSIDYTVILGDEKTEFGKAVNEFMTGDLSRKENENKKLDEESIRKDILKEFKQFDSEAKDADEKYGYTWSRNSYIVYNCDDYISLSRSDFTATGGAHGMFGGFYSVFFKHSVKPELELSDIFKGEYSEYLSEKIAENIKKEYEVENITEAGYFNEKIEITNNFYITDKGITFHYNPYEIASFAAGEIDLTIKYSDIDENYINKESEFYNFVYKKFKK